MPKRIDTAAVAHEVLLALSVAVKRLRSTRDQSLTLPETSALKLLDDNGGVTLTALAKIEGISAQSLGATISALEERGLIARHPDPSDGRQTLLSSTAAGRRVLNDRRSARLRQITAVFSEHFSESELETLSAAAPLIERLARLL